MLSLCFWYTGHLEAAGTRSALANGSPYCWAHSLYLQHLSLVHRVHSGVVEGKEWLMSTGQVHFVYLVF